MQEIVQLYRNMETLFLKVNDRYCLETVVNRLQKVRSLLKIGTSLSLDKHLVKFFLSLILTAFLFFLVCLFYMQPLIASGQIIGAHGTDLIVEWETLLQAKNSTGHRWDSNPCSCRQHSHCCKLVTPLCHLVFDIRHLLLEFFKPNFQATKSDIGQITGLMIIKPF